MKLINATVNNSFMFEGDAEITIHPTENIECIKIGDKYYSPSIVWLEFQQDDSEQGDDISDESEGIWVELDTEEEEEIISESYLEKTTLKEISEEELENYYDEDQ